MNKVQWENIVSGVLGFNKLAHGSLDRSGEDYYVMCCNLLQEEVDESIVAKKNILNYVRSEHKEGSESTELLDAWCDIAVTAIQAIDCVSPSQLDWRYCGKFLTEPVKACQGYLHTFLKPLVEAVAEAELEGVNFYGAMREVIRSNNTKIPLLTDVADQYGCGIAGLEAACDWIEDSLNYKFVINWEIVYDPDNGVEKVVFRDQYDKLRKPWCYEEPVLRGFL